MPNSVDKSLGISIQEQKIMSNTVKVPALKGKKVMEASVISPRGGVYVSEAEIDTELSEPPLG